MYVQLTLYYSSIVVCKAAWVYVHTDLGQTRPDRRQDESKRRHGAVQYVRRVQGIVRRRTCSRLTCFDCPQKQSTRRTSERCYSSLAVVVGFETEKERVLTLDCVT